MKKIIFLIALVAIYSSQNKIVAQKQLPPEAGTPKDFHLAESREVHLDNGMKGVMVSYGNIPKVQINLTVKTGNVHEANNQVWLADLTGEMLKEGSTHYNAKALARKVAAMGGDLNISVGMDQTQITGSVLSEYAADFIETLADIVINPSFPASEVKRLKDDLKRRLAVDKSRPTAQAQEKFFKAMFQDHPYGRYFPTPEMLDSYNLDMVKEFYNNNFGARRSVIYVVGKFDETSVKKAIEKSFSKWRQGPEVNYPPVPVIAAAKDTMILERDKAPQTTVLIGLPVLTPKDKDYIAQVVTNSLLGGSFGSRITSNIRENKGYTYSPFSTVTNRHGVSVWYEQADVTSEHTIDALNEIEKEINRLRVQPPTEEELNGIKKYEAGIFVLRNSSPAGIINQLNFVDQHGLDKSYLSSYVKGIYQVTPDRVTQIMKDHFDYNGMRVVMVGDKAAIQQQIDKQKETKKVF